MPRLTAIFAALVAPATAQVKVTYDEDVFPIFQQACLNCHNPDKSKGGLDLSSFTGTLKGSSGGKIVETGDTGSSLIAVVQQSAEPKMPPEGEKLSNNHIETLKRWIAGGLLENSSSSARKPLKPKFQSNLRADPAAKPDGPPPMPAHLLLEPPVVTARASAVQALAASPWAPLVAVTSQRQVLLYHTETLELIGILPFPEGDPVTLAFTPDARYLIVGGGIPGKAGITVTFDVTNGSRLLSAGNEFDSILAADLRPGFDLVATGGPSRLLKLWNTESGAMVKSIKKHTDWITALDISPDGVLLASGDRNGGVWVWESETANEFHTLRAHQAAITAAVFRSDSNILATSSEDGTVRFWEMNGGTEIKKIDAHPGGVTAFSFARDGSSLTAGRDSKLRFWKSDFSHARDLNQSLPALPTSATLDAEAKRAFVGDARGTVLVFDTANGNLLGEIPSNPPAIEARLRALDREIVAQEKALLAPASSLASQTPVRAAAQGPLTALKIAHKRWSAAAINTRLLEATHLANTASTATAESQLAFTLAASKVAQQADILNRKRNEHTNLGARPDTANWSAEARAELAATLAAIDVAIARELQSYQAAEAEFDRIARSIDLSAPLSHEQKLEAQSLRQAYAKALE